MATEAFTDIILKQLTKVKKSKFSTAFYSRHFYCAIGAATAFRTLGVGYAATREKIAPPRIEPGSVAL